MGFRIQVTRHFLAAVMVFAFATAQPVLMHAANWKQLSPATSPSARALCAMAYDPVSKKIIMFGGVGANGNLNDTWAFDGSTWTKLNTTGAPSARNGVTMAYDRPTKKLVMFGGFSGASYLSDTWVFDGATSTWTQVNIASPPPKATGAMLFSDPVTGRAIMFGGYDGTRRIPVFNNTWLWTGTAWKWLKPATFPIPRAWGIATLDPLRHYVLMTGGNGDTLRTDNTWTWDGSNWTQQSPATQVEQLVMAAYAYDPAAQAVTVFGGVAETWEWDGATWVQVVPTNSPSSRSGAAMATDQTTRQTILFGGEDANGALKETWQLVGK